jgi:hypothetical protein
MGNGGNPMMLDNSGDNSIFLENIFYSHNYMFSNLTASPRINAYNFAINGRCYDVTNADTLYDPTMINNVDFGWSSSAVNADTAMGISSIHENRYVGKAAYVFSF